MASVKKVCRVCGKTYEACHTAKKNIGEFRWQEVACSPECGAEYLRRVIASRAPAKQPVTHHKRNRPVDVDGSSPCAIAASPPLDEAPTE